MCERSVDSTPSVYALRTVCEYIQMNTKLNEINQHRCDNLLYKRFVFTFLFSLVLVWFGLAQEHQKKKRRQQQKSRTSNKTHSAAAATAAADGR